MDTISSSQGTTIVFLQLSGERETETIDTFMSALNTVVSAH